MMSVLSQAAHVGPLPHSYTLIIISRREMYRLSLPQRVAKRRRGIE